MNKQNNKTLDYIMLIPIIIFVSVTPLVFGEYFIGDEFSPVFYLQDRTGIVDYYVTYKRFCIYLCTALAIVMLIGYFFINKRIEVNKNHRLYYLFVAIYIVFLCISYFNSPYAKFDYMKDSMVYQGVGVVVCYVIMFLYTITVVKEFSQIKIILVFLFISNYGYCFIALKQFIKHEMILVTTGNSGFIAAYLIMQIPMIIAVFLCQKNILLKICCGVLLFLVTLLFFNQMTSASFIVCLVLLILFIIIFRQEITKNVIPLGIILVIICVSLYINIDGVLNEIKGNSVKEASRTDVQNLSKIDYFITDEDKLYFSYNGHKGCIIFNEDVGIKVYRDDKESIALLENKDELIMDEDYYEGIRILPRSDIEFDLKISDDDKLWKFKTINNNLYFIDDAGNCVTLQKNDKVIFDSVPQAFNGRGYIWSRTIPLIKNSIVYGCSIDRFPYIFPQNDYVGRHFEFGWIPWSAHNIYLTITLETGLLSLITLLILMASYLKGGILSLKRYKFEKDEGFYTMGLFLSIVGFLIVLCLIDHSVMYMPCFITFTSLGISLNNLVKDTSDKEM